MSWLVVWVRIGEVVLMFLGDSDNGPDLYATLPQLAKGRIKTDKYGRIPMSNLRLPWKSPTRVMDLLTDLAQQSRKGWNLQLNPMITTDISRRGFISTSAAALGLTRLLRAKGSPVNDEIAIGIRVPTLGRQSMPSDI